MYRGILLSVIVLALLTPQVAICEESTTDVVKGKPALIVIDI